MRLQEIRATFECDDCGEIFSVKIDPNNSTCKEVPTAFDLAVDAVRGGLNYDGPTGEKRTCTIPAVRGDRCLCAVCEAEDRKTPIESDQEDGTVTMHIICGDCGHPEAEVTGWEEGAPIEAECLKRGAFLTVED